MISRSSLVSIIALARSGALDRAWRLFQDAGFEHAENDPRALSVRGRLKKDQAILAGGLDRKRLYRESAASYARAAELSNTTYPLINAATLSLLAGDPENAAQLAAQVLAQSAGSGDDLETPYYRAATQAEALLLLGREQEAEQELATAIDLAPRAYEDHASTLRQFALILDERSASRAWLDPFRPPRSLHFAGHMMLSPGDQEAVAQIRDILAEERVGFGYGALAAGADILIAEALLERGAELHIILPVEPDRFRAVSVGDRNAWSSRFDAVLDAASSVEIIDQDAERPSTASLQLSAEVAMGRCTMNANMLMSESVQLLLLDGEGAPGSAGSSEWTGRRWQSSRRRQRVLQLPRSDVPRLASVVDEASSEKLVAVLRLDVSAVNPGTALAQALATLADFLATEEEAVHVPRWIDDVLVLSYETPDTALKVAKQIALVFGGTADLRIAGHYGIGNLARNPFDGSLIVGGKMPTTLAHVLRSTPLGGLHVTEYFVAALHAGSNQSLPRIQYVGELPDDPSGGTRLYAVAV